MTTPQRALELADWIKEIVSDMKEHFPHENTIDAYEELEAVARHYAEIMLAEPVATVVRLDGRFVSFTGSQSTIAELDHGTQLIIKPAP